MTSVELSDDQCCCFMHKCSQFVASSTSHCCCIVDWSEFSIDEFFILLQIGFTPNQRRLRQIRFVTLFFNWIPNDDFFFLGLLASTNPSRHWYSASRKLFSIPRTSFLSVENGNWVKLVSVSPTEKGQSANSNSRNSPDIAYFSVGDSRRWNENRLRAWQVTQNKLIWSPHFSSSFLLWFYRLVLIYLMS